MIDYSALKQAAVDSGLSPRDVLALAPQNDPFYVGTPGQRLKGKWFAQVYSAMGCPPNCHIRRVHYWLVTTNAIPKPDGKPYENTQNDWGLLVLASKYARYLGLVPIESIIDRRNPDPHVNFQFWQHQDPNTIKNSIDEDSIIESILNEFYCYNPSQTQEYMIEIWAEKSTMNDVLVPLCQQYGANLVTGLGELSITSVYLLAKRVVQSKRPVRIFYVSDFDPAGECMPVSVARKIEYFQRTLDLQEDIRLFHLMLTATQCKEFDLPRTPIKESEKRKEGFETRHGVGATELDALEALYPGKMADIIQEAIAPYFNVSAWNAAIEENNRIREQVRRYLLGADCDTCKGKGVIEDLFSTDWITCHKCKGLARAGGKIGTEILTELEIESSLETLENDNGGEISLEPLYESSLSYPRQLVRYKAHKSKESDSDIEIKETNLSYFEE